MRKLLTALILSLAASGASFAFPPGSCGECHPDIKEQYTQSVHGQARFKSGLKVAPLCLNCHETHKMSPKTETPRICGKCHVGIISVYKTSIHGKALLKDKIMDAPACTDCHGVHTIADPMRAQAPTNPANIPKTCAACHAVETLMEKYGVKTGQVATYKESFHGKANLYGRLEAANCASCHGFHDVKAVSDPASSVSKKHLADTCGKCHKNAANNPNFSKSIIHIKPSQKVEPIVFYIKIFYIAFIVLVIGGMVLYNILDLINRMIRKK